jgi:hypothetical protein
MYLCGSFYTKKNVLGVACIGLDTGRVFSDIVSVLGISDFQLSTNNYYFLKPLYSFDSDTSPQIIANFTSNNLMEIETP